MYRTMKVMALAAVVAAPALAPAQRTPAHTLARAVEAFKSAQTLRLQFNQTWSNPLTGRTGASRGELLRRSPNQVAINFTDPAGDRIVSDGTTLWIYLPSSTPGQVVKSPAGGGAGTFDPLSEILLTPADRYTIADAGTETIDGRATRAVTVVPKRNGAASTMAFTKATIWVDDSDASVQRIEATESSGLVRRVTVTKAIRDATIPASAFVFTPPPKTRIVDRTR